jgi:hypothetical protein
LVCIPLSFIDGLHDLKRESGVSQAIDSDVGVDRSLAMKFVNQFV